MTACSTILEFLENLLNHGHCRTVCAYLFALSVDTRRQASILASGMHLLLPIMATRLTERNRILDVPG